MAAGGSVSLARKWSTKAVVRRERSWRSPWCSSRENVGALAKSCVASHRKPLHPQLAHGVMPEAIGIVAIGIAGGDLVDTLREEIPEGMVDGGRMPLIMDGRRKAFGETNLAIDPAQQERTKIRREGSTVEIGAEGLTRHGRKTALLWARIAQKQTSCGLCGMDVSHLLVYQRLTRGLCLFMKNSG